MKLRAFAFALALMAFATPASAEDFTFIVPVQLSNLPPEVDEMRVGCAALILPTASAGARMVGSRTLRVPISGGAYSGDVTVSFDASRPEDLPLVNGYSCEINSFSAGHTSYYAGQPARMFPVSPGATYRYTTGNQPLP